MEVLQMKTKKISMLICWICSILLIIATLPMFGCNKVNTANFLASDLIQQGDEFPLVEICQDSKYYYLTFKIGIAEDVFVQTLTTPVKKHPGEKVVEYTISTITGKSVSNGISNSISNTKSSSVEKKTIDTTTTTTPALTKTTTNEVSVGGEISGPLTAVLTGGVKFGGKWTESSTKLISKGISEVYGTEITTSALSSITQSINEKYEVNETLQNTISQKRQYDPSVLEDNFYYAYCLICDYNLYQTFIYSADEEAVVSSYITAETIGEKIDFRSSKNGNFKRTEDDEKFLSISELPAETAQQFISENEASIIDISVPTKLNGYFPQQLISYKSIFSDNFLTNGSYANISSTTEIISDSDSPLHNTHIAIQSTGYGGGNFGGIYVGMTNPYPSVEKVYYVVALAKADEHFNVAGVDDGIRFQKRNIALPKGDTAL